MVILSKFKSHPDANNYFKELTFYNKPIEIPIKHLKNLDPLVELHFYEQLGIKKKQIKLLNGMQCHKVGIIEKKRSNCTIGSK